MYICVKVGVWSELWVHPIKVTKISSGSGLDCEVRCLLALSPDPSLQEKRAWYILYVHTCKLQYFSQYCIAGNFRGNASRPSSFSMLHAEKQEGPIHEIMCMTYHHRETLFASWRAKGHQVSEPFRLQQVKGKAPKFRTKCSMIL